MVFLLQHVSASRAVKVAHPVLTKLRQKWLDFCKEHCTSVIANKLVMMAFSSALYNSLLERVLSFQTSQSKGAAGSTVVHTAEEDCVYYRFGEELYVRCSIVVTKRLVV